MDKLTKVTQAGIDAVEAILADIKKRGRGMQFLTKVQQEDMRQKWISKVVESILKQGL